MTPTALDLPGPSRRIRVAPLRLPEPDPLPAAPDAPPPEPATPPLPRPEEPREPVPA